MKHLLTILLLACSVAGSTQTKKPNIIYIYADDLGYGELGSYGQTKIKTPNLDKMAAEGMRFTQHYSSAPVCAPSRCMLMTGKHGGHSYIRGNYEMGGFADSTEGGQMPLHEGAYTVAKMLKERGYSTALVGKWGMGVTGTTGSPLLHGFDYYYGYLDQKQAHNFYPTHLWENDRWDSLNNHFISVHTPIKDSLHATDADFAYYKGKEFAPAKMTEKAAAFIKKNQEKPFFLYLPYTLPHLSLQAPDEYVNRYRGLFDEKPYYGQKGYAATRYPRSTYAAMISFLDDQVGIIMKLVKDAGLDNNTIIMFSSDNGATFSAGVDTEFFNSVGGLRGLKMDVYEGGILITSVIYPLFSMIFFPPSLNSPAKLWVVWMAFHFCLPCWGIRANKNPTTSCILNILRMADKLLLEWGNGKVLDTTFARTQIAHGNFSISIQTEMKQQMYLHSILK
jgi:arylsulfatase A-like enzyme